MQRSWFRRVGRRGVPRSAAGWLVTAVAAGVAAWRFVAVDRRPHSASDTLFGFWPCGASLAIPWGWVASNTEGRRESAP